MRRDKDGWRDKDGGMGRGMSMLGGTRTLQRDEGAWE